MPEDWRRTSVEHWGYTCSSDQEADSLVWPVRFKPAVTLLLVLLGWAFERPSLLIVVGLLGLLGTFVQSLSWIDLLYNHGVRRVFAAPALGPDPALRRWLCGMADGFVLGSGLALRGGHPGLAFVLADLVVLLAGSVVLTGICLPAYFIYRYRIMKPRR